MVSDISVSTFLSSLDVVIPVTILSAGVVETISSLPGTVSNWVDVVFEIRVCKSCLGVVVSLPGAVISNDCFGRLVVTIVDMAVAVTFCTCNRSSGLAVVVRFKHFCPCSLKYGLSGIEFHILNKSHTRRQWPTERFTHRTNAFHLEQNLNLIISFLL